MVFCDNCDTPYHQLCHQPPVSDATIASSNKWFCSTCKPQPIDGLNQGMSGQDLSLEQVRRLEILLTTETTIFARFDLESAGGPHLVCFRTEPYSSSISYWRC